MSYDLCECGARKGSRYSRCFACRYGCADPPRLDITDAEVAWIAGILEGEGCWTTKNGRATWWISVRMTDRDIVERLATLTGIGRLSEEKPRPGHKHVWAWGVGVRQHREWLTLKVWPWLGERRRERIRQLWPEVDHAAVTQW
jgi:hypothetical protein